MSSGNRKPYLNATTFDQAFLDACHDNLTNQIEMVVEIDLPDFLQIAIPWTYAAGVVTFTFANHGLDYQNRLTISGATASGISGIQTVSRVPDANTFTIAATAGASSGTADVFCSRKIYASDRNKYVGDIFYEARVRLPSIKRTIGEWLSPTIQFDNVTLEISNVDGKYNKYLASGTNFGSFLQNRVVVKIGLRDLASSYQTIFRGRVTDIDGVQRTTKTINLVCRDEFDKINQSFPKDTFDDIEFPNISDSVFGKLKPIVYGDWTVDLDPATGSCIPCIPVNGLNPTVLGGTTNVQMYISANVNTFFDDAAVVIVRGDGPEVFDFADIVNVNVDNNRFEIFQNGATIFADGSQYTFKDGDKIFCRVQGKAIAGGYDNNIVAQAKDILTTYGGVVSGDFDTSWNTYRDKATPAVSAISTFQSRIYRDKEEKAMTYALSLLEQVRLESFSGNDLKLKVTSVHPEEFVAVPSFVLRNWDFVKDSFNPNIDAQYTFNRATGVYNLVPTNNEEINFTSPYKNQAAINASVGKVIDKGIVFPNLHVLATVTDQTKEILKLASSYFEVINCEVTWRSMLLELGQFVAVNINIGSIVFDSVPMMVRAIGYSASGKISLQLWSFQMTPFPGYAPGYFGTFGGDTAVIVED